MPGLCQETNVSGLLQSSLILLHVSRSLPTTSTPRRPALLCMPLRHWCLHVLCTRCRLWLKGLPSRHRVIIDCHGYCLVAFRHAFVTSDRPACLQEYRGAHQERNRGGAFCTVCRRIHEGSGPSSTGVEEGGMSCGECHMSGRHACAGTHVHVWGDQPDIHLVACVIMRHLGR